MVAELWDERKAITTLLRWVYKRVAEMNAVSKSIGPIWITGNIVVEQRDERKVAASLLRWVYERVVEMTTVDEAVSAMAAG